MKKVLLGAACAVALSSPLVHSAEIESIAIQSGVINLKTRLATLTGSVLVSCSPDEDGDVPVRVRADIDQKWGIHRAYGYKHVTLKSAHCSGDSKRKRILVSFKNLSLKSLQQDAFKPGTRANVSVTACEPTVGHKPDCAYTRSAIKLHPQNH